MPKSNQPLHAFEEQKTERYTVAIRELPDTEKPRERLLAHGAQVLSDKELLAIQLRIGTREHSALGVAELLLKEFGDLSGIARAPLEELKRVKGVGEVKALEIVAAIELGRRAVAFGEGYRPKISNPEDVFNYCAELRYATQEHLRTLLLDTKNQVLKMCKVTTGTLDSSLVHPREVYKDAIVNSAASIIVVHNHPSGDPTPSPEDKLVTERLAKAGEILGIKLLDHIIIGASRYVSLKECGVL